MTATQRIQALAITFHSLEDHPAVLQWDPLALDQWAAVASHGERLAVQFILNVWNQWEKWECGRFNVIEAMQVWDGRHRAAFAADPFVL